MSVDEIKSFVILFPDEASDEDIGRGTGVMQIQPNISFSQSIQTIQTLSTDLADRGTGVEGLLYVPDIETISECYDSSKYIPQNVTRSKNLPPTDFKRIALAPWTSVECTKAYLESAHMSTTKAFIFYVPDNSPTVHSTTSKYWDLEDGGKWKHEYHFPVYAIPGSDGEYLMNKLALYSGNMVDVPHGHEIASTSGVDFRDYIRVFTQIGGTRATVFPSVWMFLLVVLGVMGVLLVMISALMHLIQSRRRQSLRRRVANGEVNLEALGIKRLFVPDEFIQQLPLFIYESPGEKDLEEKESAMIEDRGNSVMSHGVSMMSETHTDSWTYNPPPFTVINDSSNNDYNFFHKFLPYSQPTCAICLDDFESGITTIRELTCGHIFHPECIDIYLGNSSLCPLCKMSALPQGYCPKITNGMVRREMLIRKLRSRVSVSQSGEIEVHDPRRALWDVTVRVWTAIFSTGRRDPDDVENIYHRPPANFVPPNHASFNERPREMTREETVEQRIRELAGRGSIQDPDLLIQQQQPWRRTLSKAFPGFA